MSKFLTGGEKLSLELRLKTVWTIMTNRSKFTEARFQNYASANDGDFEEQTLKQLNKGAYSSLRHIAALPLLLEIDIVSIYPQVKGALVRRNDINCQFKAEKDIHRKKGCSIGIMWSHTENDNLQHWSPNHFVPCVKNVLTK